MLELTRALGARTLSMLEAFGRAHWFLLQTVLAIPSVLLRPGLLIKQLYSSGVKTLSIVLVSALFVGMVLGLQGYNTLVRFGGEESLGLFVAFTLVRELGPVVSGHVQCGGGRRRPFNWRGIIRG